MTSGRNDQLRDQAAHAAEWRSRGRLLSELIGGVRFPLVDIGALRQPGSVINGRAGVL